MSCDRHYGFLYYPVCSGNGLCVDGKCVCYAGWTSVSDSQFEEGYDCEFNFNAIRVLSIIYIVVSFPGLIEGLRTVSQLKQIYSTKTACLVACLVTNIGSYVYVSLKLVDPVEYVLDKSGVLVSALALVVSAVRCIESSYTMLMIKFLRAYYKLLRENQRKKFEKYSKVWDFLMLACPVFAFVSSMVILFSVTYYYKESTDIGTVVYACTNLAVITVHFICRWSISSMFISELNEFLNNKNQPSKFTFNRTESNLQTILTITHSEMQSLLDSSLYIYNVVMIFLVNEWVVYFLVATWKFFRRKICYQVLILMISRSLVIPFYIKALQSTAEKHAVLLDGTISLRVSSRLLGMAVNQSSKVLSASAMKIYPQTSSNHTPNNQSSLRRGLSREGNTQHNRIPSQPPIQLYDSESTDIVAIEQI